MRRGQAHVPWGIWYMDNGLHICIKTASTSVMACYDWLAWELSNRKTLIIALTNPICCDRPEPPHGVAGV
jgi:hypothetical protein